MMLCQSCTTKPMQMQLPGTVPTTHRSSAAGPTDCQQSLVSGMLKSPTTNLATSLAQAGVCSEAPGSACCCAIMAADWLHSLSDHDRATCLQEPSPERRP